MKVLVLGAGTMGSGIAEVTAKAGMPTWLYDISEEFVQNGLASLRESLARAVAKNKLSQADADAAFARVRPATSLSELESIDLAIEAIPEKLELKKKTIAELSQRFPSAVLASNTSSLSLSEIASASSAPELVIGLHFFNPPPVMELVEIVVAEQSAKSTLELALKFVAEIKKTPIVVKDSPGFATSRLGVVIGLEAIRMLESGVASAEDIDRAMELGYKHPMGPLKLTDLVGLDVRLAIAEHLAKEIGPQFSPPPLLKRMVAEGKTGKKSGEGFYRWDGNVATPIA